MSLREKIQSILRDSWDYDFPEDSGCDFAGEILDEFKAHIAKFEKPKNPHTDRCVISETRDIITGKEIGWNEGVEVLYEKLVELLE